MLMLKKISLWFLYLYSSLIFSGRMGQCQTENIGICADHVWQFGGHAIYAELSPASFEFEQNLDLSANLPWSWGFAVDGSYKYGGGDDISMNWYHYRSQTTNQLQVPQDHINWTTQDLYTNFSINNAKTVASPAWDQVNFEIGKTIQLRQMDKWRLHGGLNFSHLAYGGNLSLEGQFQSLNQAPTNFSQWQRLDASYNGLGLRSGFLLAHDFQNHFRVFADAAVSLLGGREKISKLINSEAYNGIVDTSQMRIVSEFDARVGTQYDYHLPEGLLSAEISWLWLNYMNVFSHEANNFGLQGLYFGLKWSGDIE